MPRLLPLLFVLCVSWTALAEPPLHAAREAHRAGAFAEAAALAETLDTAEGDALAAYALLVAGAYLAPRREGAAMVLRAEQLARRALDRDPQSADGLLHLVVALGYRARIEGTGAAHRKGYGSEAKRAMKRATAVRPDDPWLHAIRGGWHGEIVSRGGAFGALLYGASEKNARRSFDRAVALAPEDPALRVEYAKTLLHLGLKHKEAARVQLEAAEGLAAQDAFGELLAEQGRALLAAIRSGDDSALKRALDLAMPFAGEDEVSAVPSDEERGR